MKIESLTPRSLLLPLAALLLVACGTGEPADDRQGAPAEEELLAYGEHEDAFCGEPVDELRYGGQARTRDGRVFHFRSVECLAGFVLSDRIPRDEIREVKVVDFNHGRRLIDAESALYIRSRHRSSPDGLNFMALGDERIADNVHFAWGGERMEWPEVLETVREAWEIGSGDFPAALDAALAPPPSGTAEGP